MKQDEFVTSRETSFFVIFRFIGEANHIKWFHLLWTPLPALDPDLEFTEVK